MVAKTTPVCEFGKPAIDFRLPGTDGKHYTLDDCYGENGVLVMFICNHCPFVKAIQKKLAHETQELKKHGINTVAIMSNDPDDYPEDSFENMKKVAKKFSYSFPYLFDETQEVAKKYGAVCTPDFFGYNTKRELQFRGRLDSSGMEQNVKAPRELFEAMKLVAETGQGPEKQTPSIGCSIKWR